MNFSSPPKIQTVDISVLNPKYENVKSQYNTLRRYKYSEDLNTSPVLRCRVFKWYIEYQTKFCLVFKRPLNIRPFGHFQPNKCQTSLKRQDSTDDRAAASYPAYPGLNTVDSFMLQRALHKSSELYGCLSPQTDPANNELELESDLYSSTATMVRL